MSERYTLNEKGIIARNELLRLLNLRPGGRIVSKVANIVDLDRATTTQWILSDPVQSVQRGELRQFFVKLIEKIGDDYASRCDKHGVVNDEVKRRIKRSFLISD